jgi:hypothetical protein
MWAAIASIGVTLLGLVASVIGRSDQGLGGRIKKHVALRDTVADIPDAKLALNRLIVDEAKALRGRELMRLNRQYNRTYFFAAVAVAIFAGVLVMLAFVNWPKNANAGNDEYFASFSLALLAVVLLFLAFLSVRAIFDPSAEDLSKQEKKDEKLPTGQEEAKELCVQEDAPAVPLGPTHATGVTAENEGSCN